MAKTSRASFLHFRSTLWWPEHRARHRAFVVVGEMSVASSTSLAAARFLRGTRRVPARRVHARRVVPKSSTRVASTAATSSATAVVCGPAFASAGDRVVDLALSDAWFGWYFAPGGVVLGPALFFTACIVGQALFEKLTGTGPKGKKKE